MFYHSVVGKEVIGIAKVSKEFYPDPTDKTKKFVAVDVKIDRVFIRPVDLNQIKNNKKLFNFRLFSERKE